MRRAGKGHTLACGHGGGMRGPRRPRAPPAGTWMITRGPGTRRLARGLKGQTLTLLKGSDGPFCPQAPHAGQGREGAASAETTPCGRGIPSVRRRPPGFRSKRASFPGPRDPRLQTVSSGHAHVTKWNLCVEGEAGQPPAAGADSRAAARAAQWGHLSSLPQRPWERGPAWPQQHNQEAERPDIKAPATSRQSLALSKVLPSRTPQR